MFFLKSFRFHRSYLFDNCNRCFFNPLRRLEFSLIAHFLYFIIRSNTIFVTVCTKVFRNFIFKRFPREFVLGSNFVYLYITLYAVDLKSLLFTLKFLLFLFIEGKAENLCLARTPSLYYIICS